VWRLQSSSRRRERGAALVELALATPLLAVLIVGAVDFARIFYLAMQVTNAARAGAQYGSTSTLPFVAANVKTKAESASPQIAPYTVATPVESCFCMTNTGGSTAQTCTVACGSGTHKAVFITVTASKAFSPVMRFPGIPSSLTITRTVTLRRQP
jgi:Flp pilus assembly protein TadG